MDDAGSTLMAVILRVHRFTPRTQHAARRSSSPFARKSSPFGRSSSPFADSRSTAGSQLRGKRWVQEYRLDAHPEDTILDCLLTIKRTQDPTLAFAYSCGHGMCGSDAVSVNGTPTLLCTATIGGWVQRGGADGSDFRRTGTIRPSTAPVQGPKQIRSASFKRSRTMPQSMPGTGSEHRSDNANASPAIIDLEALPGFPTQRDLIADTDAMFSQIRRLKAYLHAAEDFHTGENAGTDGDHRTIDHEYLQSPEELRRYELLSDCIACGVCEGSCPVYSGGEAFVGPAALIMASRFINDSRDAATGNRLDAIDAEDGITACQSVRACSRHCPRGIDVGEEMWQLTTKVNERHHPDADGATAITQRS